jgi:hypothetical protein
MMIINMKTLFKKALKKLFLYINNKILIIKIIYHPNKMIK